MVTPIHGLLKSLRVRKYMQGGGGSHMKGVGMLIRNFELTH